MSMIDYRSRQISGEALIAALCQRLEKKDEFFTDGNIVRELRNMDSETLVELVTGRKET